MMETCVWVLCTSDTWCSKQLEGGVWFVPFFKPGRSAENCKHWIKACSRLLEQMNMNIIDNNRHLLGCTKVSTKDHLLPSPSERSKVSQSLFILPPKPMAFYFAKAKFFFFLLLFFFVFFFWGGGGCCPINCADLRGTAPAPLVPASLTSGHTQGSLRIAAPPPEVHRKWRQIVGRLPSERNTALLLSHFGGVQ